MLVLTRRAGESLIIGDGIEITVIESGTDKVKIGISAPKSVRILRGELVREVSTSNTEAAGISISLKSLSDAINRR